MSSRVQDNNKGEKKVIKDLRLRHTIIIFYIIPITVHTSLPNILQTEWLQPAYLEKPTP